MRIGKKQLSSQREEWNNNVYLLVALVEGSGSMGLHTTLLHPYSCYFFWENSANLSALCQVISTVQTSLFELDKCKEIWLLSPYNEKRKILLNPVQQCKTQGLIKVSLLKELCNTSTGKQNIRQDRKKRKAVIIKRDFNLKHINKCTMNSQDRKCTRQPPEGCSFHTLDSCATFQAVVRFSLLMTVIAHLPKIGL